MSKLKVLTLLVLLMTAVTGAMAKKDYYAVTFSGCDANVLNTTVYVTLPSTIERIGEDFYDAYDVMGEQYGDFTTVYLKSGGDGKVSVTYDDWGMYITITGAFEGTATIHCEAFNEDDEETGSRDIYVACVYGYEAYDVTYDANGGSGAPSAQEKRNGTDLTLSTAEPTREGYPFFGWNTAQDGSGDSYAPGATYTANADVTLYAQWTAPAPAGYTVSMPQDTPDAGKWTARAGTDGTYQQLPLEGVAQGAQVSLKYEGALKVKSVRAKKAAPANVPVTSITLNKTATEITVGQTETLSVTEVLPANATDPTYTWKSSDETKATVDQDGMVTAKAEGTVNIYAEANDGSGVKGECAVTMNWAAAETLAETMTIAGVAVKVNYNYQGEANYCLFVSNGDGTYSFLSGSGFAGGDTNMAKALVVEDGKLVFKQNVYDTIDDSWDRFGFSVTFNTSKNIYSEWFGEKTKEIFNPSFTSVEVNGTAIAVIPLITVTWNNDDITDTGSGDSFTKDGVTITAGSIDFGQKNFMEGGTFTTTLGNFTRIEVSANSCDASGTGWSGNYSKRTWTGNASSVSYSGEFSAQGMGNIKFVFTIEPTN